VQGALCLTVSQSGGSPDLVAVQSLAREAGALTLAILNTVDSPVGRGAALVAPQLAGPERAVAATKSYVASVTLGIASASEDAEGPLSCPVPRPRIPGRPAVETVLDRFRGGYEQVPPRHSAVRVDGQRAWKRTRRGEEVEMRARAVSIDRLEILEFDGRTCRLAVDCGPGTYIRSLARDLGDALGCGAYLAALSRTRIGTHEAGEATDLSALDPNAWWSLERVLEGLPTIDVPPEAAARLAHGQRVAQGRDGDGGDAVASGSCVVRCEGRVVGLGEVHGRVIQPRRWLRDAPPS